jgi:hypothetical protein
MEIEIEYMEEADDALARNEAIIRKGLIDIGQAFKEIVKWKLYKAKGYKTFNEYCRGEWDYSYPMVACIMKFSETAQGISTIVDISGMRETIIRETLSLPNNETRAEVIKKVLETNPKPTAKEMKAAVEEKLVEILPGDDPKVQKIKAKADRSIGTAKKKFVKFWSEFSNEFSNIPQWQLDEMAIKAIQNR